MCFGGLPGFFIEGDMDEALKSYEQALVRRDELKREIQSLQTEIAMRNKTDEDGNRLTGKAYWRWRDDAVRRIDRIGVELREVKAFLRRHHVALDNPDPEIDYANPRSILMGARRVIMEYAKAEGLTEKASKVLSAIQHFCQTSPQENLERW